MKPSLLRIFVTIAAAGFVLLSSAAEASADCHGDGVDSGSATKYKGAGTQTMQWSLSGKRVWVYSYTEDDMSTSVCLESKFDWMTNNGHYDARVSRNCSVDSVYGGSISEAPNFSGASVTGVQKSAGCRFVQSSSVYASDDCAYISDSVPGCKWIDHLGWTSPSHAAFLRKQNGDPEFNDGGDPTSGTS
jgi:hypothetical protein